MDLFGDGVAAAERPELVDLAQALPRGLRMGTSSWSFPGWQGLVWRHASDAGTLSREGLVAYARHPLLRSVGVDRTYYAPVSAEVYSGWAAQVPLDFRFLVKAHDALTTARTSKGDNPRFLDPEHARKAVIAPAVEGLGVRLGTVLFQFPPTPPSVLGRPDAFAERLRDFLTALPEGPHYAVEIRTAEWMTPAYSEALIEAGASHSYVVHPRMPSVAEQVRAVRGGARHGLIIRWMLQSGMDYESAKARFAPFRALAAPDEDSRSELSRLIGLALGRDIEVIVIINNKAEGSAPLSVEALAKAVRGRISAGG